MTANATAPSFSVPYRSGWGILWRYVADNREVYSIAFVAIALSSTLAALIPRLIGRLADLFASRSLDPSQAQWIGTLVFLVGSVRVVSGWLGRHLTAQHGRILVGKIRQELFEKWQSLPPGYHHRHSTGELLSHALSDVDVVRQAAAMGINTAVNGVFMVGAASWFMFVQMDARLALVGLLPLFAIPVLIHLFGPPIKDASARFQASLGGMSQAVEEVVGGIRTVKAFGNESIELRRFHSHLDELVDRKLRYVKVAAVFGALVPLASSIGFVGTLWYGGFLVIRQELGLGDLVGFLLYLTLLKQPLEQLGNLLNIVQRASVSLSRLKALLDADAGAGQQGIDVDRGMSIEGSIEVRDLTFAYDGAGGPVLRNLSFKVERGGVLGIVGAVGSGKTTLAHLFLRLYEPPPGTVFVDGVDVRDIALSDLRSAISYVPQTGFLFSCSIETNIGFSADDGTPDPVRVARSAKLAGIAEEIERFPDGYSTEIGERGVRLSGGQKQRLAIARMAHKEARIRILDDSLSAVDTRTERAILENFSREGRKPTSVVVSHRLSAVRDADEILVLDGGRVAERGTHEQLLSRNGVYARLWALQAGEADGPEHAAQDPVPRGTVLETPRRQGREAVRSEVEEEA